MTESTPQDFRESGRQLAGRFLQRNQDFQKAFRQALLRPFPHCYDFVRSVYQHARGDSSYLIEYFRSDRPIIAGEGEQLAQFFEGVLDRIPARGRPRDKDVRSAAMAARVFYKQWREYNRRLGINDRGKSDAMKDESVRLVIEDLEPTPGLDPERVRDLMDRSERRRNS